MFDTCFLVNSSVLSSLVANRSKHPEPSNTPKLIADRPFYHVVHSSF